MSLYSRFVLPRVLDFAMKYEELTELRAKAIPEARGIVVEVGIGSGLNLPFYSPATVSKLYGVDPSAELLAMTQEKIAGVKFAVTLINQPAHRIPLDDQSADTVVLTWSLCSIQNPVATLAEIRRVLKHDGQLIFVEHGLSPDVQVQSWQNRLTPLWRHLAGGCHLNRKMDDVIRSAGFSITKLETRYVAGPKPLTYMYSGVGIRG
jgi:ubiquinone/menaquinone biosynthesis C-methylase UbiE